MKKIKVRFNLGAGKNYMKWKVEIPGETPKYISPEITQLLMKGCTLRNSPATAAKIHAGAHKTVCAWILCDEITILTNLDSQPMMIGNLTQLAYNPRVQPNWLCGNKNVDGQSYDKIISLGKQLYTELKNIS